MKQELKKVEKDLDKKFLKFYTAHYETDGKEREYFFVSRNDEKDLAVNNKEIKPTAVECFTYIKENGEFKIIMIEEFRSALNRRICSFCAGLIEPNEKVEKSIEREIFEELGGKVKSVEMCQDKPLTVSAGMTDEALMFAFVELESMGEQHLEELEDIAVLKFTIKDLENKIKNNKLDLTAGGYFGAMLLINKLKEA